MTGESFGGSDNGVPRPPGRTAFVTGAARGLGAATALALAARGIAPVLAVRDPAAAAQTLAAVRALGIACRVEACDVADAAAVGSAVAASLRAWGRLDVVVNNAATIDPIGHLADTDPAVWARAIAVNLTGAYNVVHAAMPALLDAGGCIVNVSSGAAHGPREGWSAYCASKAGLAMLTRCLALEYGGRGVAVYGLQPGLVDTDMQVRIRGSGMNEISRVPRDQLAPPDRPAQLIAWLADTRPADLAGSDASVRDPAFVQRATADASRGPGA